MSEGHLLSNKTLFVTKYNSVSSKHLWQLDSPYDVKVRDFGNFAGY